MANRFVTLSVVLAMIGVSHAENAKLAQARNEIDAVHYDKAQSLLVEALKAGNNTPADVAEIYRLSASTAIVLGKADVAEQYYRRWLALDPRATLSSDLAPKLREPFVAAQAYMQARGSLAVRVARRSATEIEVVVESDPLAMVASVTLDGGAPAPLGVDHRRVLTASPATKPTVFVLDELGNHLRELPVAETVSTTVQRADVAPARAEPQEPSFFTRWYVWAVPAVAGMSIGAAFGVASGNADEELTQMLYGKPFYSDVEELRAKRDRDALLGNVVGGIGVGFAAVATYFFVMERRRKSVAVAPTGGSGAVGFTVSGSW